MLIYRLLATLAAPVVAAMLLWRLLRGRETATQIAERLGEGPKGTKSAIWIHGASNGELTSARTLIEQIIARFPDRALLVTCNTTTAVDMVHGWSLPHVTAQLAPLDLQWIVGRLLARWRPAAMVVLENELWPNRFAAAQAAGIPILCIGARMSHRSALRWSKAPGIARQMLSGVRYLTAQDPTSAKRLCILGLPETALGPTGTLKAGVTLPAPDSDTLADLQAIFPRARTLLAASTHEGEEAVVLDAFQTARESNPRLKLILAPRHPRRSAEITALIEATGLPFAIRSKDEAPDAQTAIYLADTMGEMPLWYSLAGLTFVGGSLAQRGGHTPYEPAAFRSAILHGTHTGNFTAPYAALREVKAAIEVTDSQSLAKAITRLTDPKLQKTMTTRATKAFDAEEDVIPPFLTALQNAIQTR